MASTEKLINSLIHKTKEKKIIWEYLSLFPKLKNLSINIAVDTIDPFVDSDCVDNDLSFYSEYKDGYFVLLNIKPEILLIVFPTIDARIKKPLNTPFEYQTELLRLTNLATRQHPNVEDFIDDFLADGL